MKRLYLLRHAKSSWKKPVDDFDRGLNKRGKRDLEFMPSLIKTKVSKPDLILSSDAKRAKKTAQAVSKKYEMDIEYNNSIYEASYEQLLKIVQMLPNEIQSVFIVGHNPGLNMLAEYLTGKFIENIPTFGFYGIEFKTNDWADVNKATGYKIVEEYPKKYQ